MNTKLPAKLIKPIKLIKKEKREAPEVPVEIGLVVDPNRWSTAVRAWVNEFQGARQRETLPAFDSLFKTHGC